MIAELDAKFVRMRLSKLWSRLLGYIFFEGRPLTTKGQWFNKVVFFVFRFAQFFTEKSSVGPVFIIGTGRSGTTILGSIMSMHRDISYLNEPKAMWSFAFPGEDLIGSYCMSPAKYRLTETDASSVGQRKIWRVYSLFSRLTGGKLIVDKYPELIFRYKFVKAIFPNAKFLFLSRNGRDTCSSISKWSAVNSESVDGEKHDWWGRDNRKWTLLVDQLVDENIELKSNKKTIESFENEVDKAVVEWIITMQEGLRLRKEYPEDVYHIKYEDLCKDPKAILEEVCTFSGISKDDSVFYEYASTTLVESNKVGVSFKIYSELVFAFNSVSEKLGYEIYDSEI